ncbi:fumarylacetoacetate hydrolase family protein [Nocardiopsis ganjiahuensis]|uniref:fumarylacetoacetate hydrolase family protein n=1 Tax=Nocardiopsis ganjiahuensis TaxID=239984 RepID=UPI00034D8B62|nr:fumarylacetoacetate hydrolase family protein [Nocardiopsis ganjiahuensis]
MDGFLRYYDRHDQQGLGWHDGQRRTVHAVPGVRSMAELLRLPLDEARTLAGEAAGSPPLTNTDAITPLPPVDGDTEVWAAGVTYERSRRARGEESDHADIYDRVYTARRPELFFKAPAWRVVTEAEPVAVRSDSSLNVPEPELAVVANAHGQIVGYCVCDDVSSRAIEGENALYLPQAKVYAGSCSLSPLVRPSWELPDPLAGEVTMRVLRRGRSAFEGRVRLRSLRRDPADLVEHLFRSQPFPDGAVLATGTGIVPDMDFTLAAGDTVDIAITGVGTLTNPVVRGREAMDWLVAARETPAARRRN